MFWPVKTCQQHCWEILARDRRQRMQQWGHCSGRTPSLQLSLNQMLCNASTGACAVVMAQRVWVCQARSAQPACMCWGSLGSLQIAGLGCCKDEA